MNKTVEVSIDRQEGLDAILSVTVSPEDYQQEIEKSLGKYSKTINIKGFRPGKVPRQIVRRMFYEDIKKEQVQKLVDQGIKNFISENDVKLLMDPILIETGEINWKEESPLNFKYNIGYKPEIDLNPEALGEFTYYKFEPNQEDIEKEIELLRKDKGQVNQYEEVSDVENLNMVLKVTELNPEGEEQEGGITKTKVVSWSELNQTFKSFLLGKKTKEPVKVNLKDLLSNEELEKLLDTDNLTVQDLHPEFILEIMDVFVLEPAQMNESFYKQVFSDKEISDKEELDSEIKNILQWYYERESNNILFEELRKRVLNEFKIDMPNNYLKRWTELYYKDKEGEDLNKKIEEIRLELKWDVFTKAIATKFNIEVNEHEIIDFTMSLFKERFSRAGLGDQMGEEFLMNYVMQYLREQKNLYMVKSNILDQKVFENLKDQLKLNETVVSKEEFDKIRQDNK